MRPEALKEMIDEFDQMERDEVPESYYPRYFYFGHKLLYGITPPKDSPKYIGKESGIVYEMTDRSCRWQCVTCSHEWEGEDGTCCPKCGHVRNK